MSAPPILLTLPREVRDQIYGYVWHEKRFNWAWRRWEGFAEDDEFEGSAFEKAEDDAPIFDYAILEVRNCPCVSLLLTHPQLYAEYNGSLQLRELFLSVNIDMADRECIDMYEVELEGLSFHSEAAMVSSIMRKAKVITLLVGGCIASDWGEEVTGLIKSIKIASPDLMCLRLAVQDRSFELEHSDFLATCISTDTTIEVSTMKDYESFAQENPPSSQQVGLQLNQHCKAYRIGCDPDALYPSLDDRFSHFVYQIGLFIYTDDQTLESNWKPENVLDLLPLKAYPTELLNTMEPETAKKLGANPFKMLDWEDMDVGSTEK